MYDIPVIPEILLHGYLSEKRTVTFSLLGSEEVGAIGLDS